MIEDILRETIGEVIENAEDAQKLPYDAEGFKDGKMLAYMEILSALKNKLLTLDPDAPEAFGISFDVDERFA